MSDERRIRVGTADGDPVTLPVVEVLTGRAAIMGKSGSGKSNTMSVVAEELLEQGYPLLIVDTDGEYYGLKEEYELLHAGADGECDIQVGPEHAEKIASLALEEKVPVILDVSGYLDGDAADDLVRETARHLFAKEKKVKTPFLLVVEEIHEYVPESGGLDGTGRMLVKVGKRGRKHGLGIAGISQRPADVKKDFITQANWLVWHRLTWENDTKVVGRVVGEGYADAAADLDDGEAFVQRDWTDGGVTRVRFDRKRTFDAGATPGLDDVERPELKSVSETLVDDLHSISEREERREDRIEELERELESKDERIAELEAELRSARDVSRAARQMANALSGGDGVEIEGKNERIEALEAEIASLRGELAAADDGHTPDAFGVDDGGGDGGPADRGIDDDRVDAHMERLRRKGEGMSGAALDLWSSPFDGDAGSDGGAGSGSDGRTDDATELLDLLHEPAVVARIDGARRDSNCGHEHAWSVVAALASRGPRSLQELAAGHAASTESIRSLLAELRARSLVTRDADRRYAFDGVELRRLAAEADGRAARTELASQWD